MVTAKILAERDEEIQQLYKVRIFSIFPLSVENNRHIS